MATGSTFSVIGADVTIKGNISASADLHIDGTIDGDITCANLVQGEKSSISGGVVAESARLAGRVAGIKRRPAVASGHRARPGPPGRRGHPHGWCR